ncbi:MAG: hypothetical protein VYA67_23115 [Actinomycetota bacterium]|uniref:Uncharacterized protein n=1 Tax=Mycobacterium lentiflavum TaxID=141349 RepID=A0ABY3USC9_MYCLN|nr:hypothetical protein [Mycobacterium lentiflavum]MEE3066786.1 hypothetical protein [Actinomycetota bacterium]ULP40362.1 hypothetical protein MJO58_15175 [Mycobacterium lentiflavum]
MTAYPSIAAPQVTALRRRRRQAAASKLSAATGNSDIPLADRTLMGGE